MASEKESDMYELIMKKLKESGLEIRKIAAITMGNTNANFGGINRNGRNNIFQFLKQGFANYLIKLIKEFWIILKCWELDAHRI